MSNEITKDNIMEVLIYNRINIDVRIGVSFSETYRIYIRHESISRDIFSCDLNRNWLAALEAFLGKKLEPLPKANPFDAVKVGDWVRCQCACDNTNAGEWYQKQQTDGFYKFDYRDNTGFIRGTNKSENWELTDIRDYNPTECELKIGDVIDFGSFGNLPIDEFNYIDECIETNLGGSLICRGFKNLQNNDNKKSQIINSRQYDKITIPKFDFKQYLLNNGFTAMDIPNILNGDIYLSLNAFKIYINPNQPNYFYFQGNSWKRTPANAQILIEITELMKGLK